MPERSQGPDFYRSQAKTLREIAAKAPTGAHQETLLKIALDYERLAESVEKLRHGGR
jgi:hypothetical protein